MKASSPYQPAPRFGTREAGATRARMRTGTIRGEGRCQVWLWCFLLARHACCLGIIHIIPGRRRRGSRRSALDIPAEERREEQRRFGDVTGSGTTTTKRHGVEVLASELSPRELKKSMPSTFAAGWSHTNFPNC